MLRIVKKAIWMAKCFAIFLMILILTFAVSYYALNLVKPGDECLASVAGMIGITTSFLSFYVLVKATYKETLEKGEYDLDQYSLTAEKSKDLTYKSCSFSILLAYIFNKIIFIKLYKIKLNLFFQFWYFTKLLALIKLTIILLLKVN